MKSSFTLAAAATALVSLLSVPFINALPATAQGAALSARSHHKPHVHHVQVGGANIFAFTPGYVFTKPGDTVRFEFLQLNHTLTQSTFEDPCYPLDGGADSGFMFNPEGIEQTFFFDLEIPKDSQPDETFYFYCKQGDHCNKRGMVFVVNPNVDRSFTEFFKRAKGLID